MDGSVRPGEQDTQEAGCGVWDGRGGRGPAEQDDDREQERDIKKDCGREGKAPADRERLRGVGERWGFGRDGLARVERGDVGALGDFQLDRLEAAFVFEVLLELGPELAGADSDDAVFGRDEVGSAAEDAVGDFDFVNGGQVALDRPLGYKEEKLAQAWGF